MADKALDTSEKAAFISSLGVYQRTKQMSSRPELRCPLARQCYQASDELLQYPASRGCPPFLLAYLSFVQIAVV